MSIYQTNPHSIDRSLLLPNVNVLHDDKNGLPNPLDNIINQLSKIRIYSKPKVSSCCIPKCIKRFFSAIARKIMQIYRKIFPIKDQISDQTYKNNDNGKKILLGIPDAPKSISAGSSDIDLVPFKIDTNHRILKDDNGNDVSMPRIFSADWQRFQENKIPFKINKRNIVVNDERTILKAINLLKKVLGDNAAIATSRFLCQTAIADITKLVTENFKDHRFKPDDPNLDFTDPKLNLHRIQCTKRFDFKIKLQEGNVVIKITSEFKKSYFHNNTVFGHPIKAISTYTIPLETLKLLGNQSPDLLKQIPLDTVDLNTKYRIITRELPTFQNQVL